MPTQSSKRPPTTAGKRRTGAPDAIAMLRDDHKRVSAMFAEFRALAAHGSGAAKQTLALRICDELKVHTKLEEEIFYPAARAALDEMGDGLLDEAEVEHASARELIAQIESASPADDLFDAKVSVLGEYVKHHVKEEQEEMFPKCRKARMDLRTIGAEMTARRKQLT